MPSYVGKTASHKSRKSHETGVTLGCSGVAAFIKIVGRGLWTDEEMNVSQWQAHKETVSKQRQR